MKETFKILFFARKDQLKNNGLSTIMIRITIKGKQIQFSSGLDVEPSAWNQKENRVTEGSFLYLNTYLEEIRSKIQRIYAELSLKYQSLSPERLKQAYLGNNAEMLLSYQFREQVKIFRSKNGRNISKKTAECYKLTHQRIEEFVIKKYRKKDIVIHEIDLLFLEHFYTYLRKTYNCSNNTTIKYMKRFAAIMNFTEKTGLLQVNPFHLFRFHIEKKSPVYLNENEINSIINKPFMTERLNRIKDAFVFCCWTGLSYTDIYNLKVSDIEYRNKQYWLIIIRKKTGNISQIPLLDVPLMILKRLHPDFYIKKGDTKLFRMPSNQKVNEYLKEIASICNINKKLSFHVSRHSFATLALNNGVSMESVSKMLGHTSIRTTLGYANITNRKIGSAMNKMKYGMNDLFIKS
ncbi:MAG: site-specific integrase [Dysgonomonas sp.]